jgi:hypothetical protein
MKKILTADIRFLDEYAEVHISACFSLVLPGCCRIYMAGNPPKMLNGTLIAKIRRAVSRFLIAQP